MTKTRGATVEDFAAFSPGGPSLAGETIATRMQRKQTEQREFQLVLALIFSVFLMISLVSRVLPRSWRPLDRGHNRSVIGEAKAAAHEMAPFLFMR